MAGAVQQEINEAIASFFHATLPQVPKQDLVKTAPPVSPHRDEYDRYFEEQDRRERREEFWSDVKCRLALFGMFVVAPPVLTFLLTLRDEQKRSINVTQDLSEFVKEVDDDPALANLSEEDRALFKQIQLEQARLHRSAWDKSNFQQEEHRKLQAEADFLTTTLRQLRLKMHSQENR